MSKKNSDSKNQVQIQIKLIYYKPIEQPFHSAPDATCHQPFSTFCSLSTPSLRFCCPSAHAIFDFSSVIKPVMVGMPAHAIFSLQKKVKFIGLETRWREYFSPKRTCVMLLYFAQSVSGSKNLLTV